MFVKSVLPKEFNKKTQKAYRESEGAYKKLFESKEFYNAVLNSIGNVIYRMIKSEVEENK